MEENANISFVVPNAVEKLKEAGLDGMEIQEFFNYCRKLDKEMAPLGALKVLYDSGMVDFVYVSGTKTNRIKYIY